MKKAMVVIIYILSLNLCYGQSTINEQHLIGTWEINSNSLINLNYSNYLGIWNFNTNGTFRIGDSSSGRFGVTDTKLYLLFTNRSIVFNFDYSISSDGKTLILTFSDGSNGFWLTKK